MINQFVLLRLLTLGQRKYVSSMKNSHLQVSSQKPTMPSVFKINRLLVTFATLNNEITYGEKVWDGKLTLWKQDFRSLQLNQLSNLFTTPFRGLVAMNIFYEYIFDFFPPLL